MLGRIGQRWKEMVEILVKRNVLMQPQHIELNLLLHIQIGRKSKSVKKWKNQRR